jgi:hypothetical protein
MRFPETTYGSTPPKRSWCDENPRGPSTPRPSFKRAIATVAALRSGRQRVGVLVREAGHHASRRKRI